MEVWGRGWRPSQGVTVPDAKQAASRGGGSPPATRFRVECSGGRLGGGGRGRAMWLRHVIRSRHPPAPARPPDPAGMPVPDACCESGWKVRAPLQLESKSVMSVEQERARHEMRRRAKRII